jgi:hypothetical protein
MRMRSPGVVGSFSHWALPVAAAARIAALIVAGESVIGVAYPIA